MGIIEGLAFLGTAILGPALGAALAFGVTPPMVGAAALGAGTASLAGGGGAAAAASNPHILNGIENATVTGHNDLVAGSAQFLNGLQLPGIPQFHVN